MFLPPSPSRGLGTPARCRELGDGTGHQRQGCCGHCGCWNFGQPRWPQPSASHRTHARSAWLSDQYVFMLHWETKKKKKRWEGKGGEDDVFSTGTVADNCLQEICLNTWWLLDPEVFAVALNCQLQTPVPDKSSHARYKRYPRFSPKNPLSHFQQASCNPSNVRAHRHHLLPRSCPLPSIPAPLRPRTCLGLQEQSASPRRRGPPRDSCSLLSAGSTGSPGPFPSLLAFKGFQSLSFSKPNYSSTIPPTGLGARSAASPLPCAQHRKVTARGQRRRDRYGAFSPCTALQTSGSFWKGLRSRSRMSREPVLSGLGHLEVLCVLWSSSSVGEVGPAR